MRSLAVVAIVLTCVPACDRERSNAVIGVAVGESALTWIRVAEQELAEIGESRIKIAYDTAVSSTDPETEARRAARILEYEGLVGVVGHSGSRGSLIGAPMYNEAGVVQIAPTSTSRRMKDAGPWTFTLAPNDSLEGAALARFAADELGAGQVTLFYVTDEYGYGLRDGIVGECERMGVTLLDAVPIPPRYQLLEREEIEVLSNLTLAALGRGRPDVVLLAARSLSGGVIIRLMLDIHPEVRFVAGDGVQATESFAETAGPVLDRVYLATFWDRRIPDAKSLTFMERYRSIHGTKPIAHEALNHDAMMLLAEAVREVGTDRAAVRDFLLSLGVSREPYEGVTGNISFGSERVHPIHMIRADSLVGN